MSAEDFLPIVENQSIEMIYIDPPLIPNQSLLSMMILKTGIY